MDGGRIMKDLAYRGLPELAISVGDTSPIPSSGQKGMVWSTTINDVLLWNGAVWSKVGDGVNSGTVYSGIVLIDFGIGQNEASVTVYGLDNLNNTDAIDTWISADDSVGNHSTGDHRYLSSVLGLTVGDVVAGSSFTIYARSLYKLSGIYKIRYSYSQTAVAPSSNASTPSGEYVRPSDWLALPIVADTEDKIVGLLAILPGGSNYLAFTIAGNYQVDWGDGNTNTYSSGVTAEHLYDYASISSSTLTSDGFKQVLVTITPQGGSQITSINLSTLVTLPSYSNYNWLDLYINTPNLTTCTIFSSTVSTNARFSKLERVNINKSNFSGSSMSNLFMSLDNIKSIVVPYSISSSCTNLSNIFYGCTQLRNAPYINTAACTDFSNMFQLCSTLVYVPMYNTSAGTSFTGMFQYCQMLQQIPALTLTNATNIVSMFEHCISIVGIPDLNISSCTNMTSAFMECYSLRKINLTTSVSLSLMTQAFQNCFSLTSVSLSNTSGVTYFSYCFDSCYSLIEAPDISTVSALSTTNMFKDCRNLVTVPLYSTVGVTNFSGMFYQCLKLSKIPTFNTSSGVDFIGMFYFCLALSEIPALDMSGATSDSEMYLTFENSGIAKSSVTGVTKTHSYEKCRLSATELNNIYTNLGTVSGKSITVTGNPGTSGDNPTIATSKGWTVVG